MGFGSYDESEQQNGSTNEEADGETVIVHENDHQGELEFGSDASTNDLVARLDEMKSDSTESDDE